MKRIIVLTIIATVFFAASCTKDSTSKVGTSSAVDPDNYFTATFSGKTIKTSGIVITVNGQVDYSANVSEVAAHITTQNTSSGSVQSDLILAALGSSTNLAWGTLYKFPVQNCDAMIYASKSGNAIGNYQVDQTLGLAKITDLAAGNKVYDLDPVSTVITVTSTDAIFVQGTYTGKLKDGSTYIPVNGSFKMRKF